MTIRKSSDDDTPFRILSDTAKMTALKLISIFRMVRAMDISRKQKLKDITARATGDILIIEYDSRENTALETWMFDKNKEFFENVYGLGRNWSVDDYGNRCKNSRYYLNRELSWLQFNKRVLQEAVDTSNPLLRVKVSGYYQF